MVDKKLTEIGAETSINDADIIYGVKTPDSSPTSVKYTWTSVKTFLKTYLDTLYLALTGGTVTGLVNFGENSGFSLYGTLSAHSKYSGIVETGTLGATVTLGQLCYLQTSDSRWELADANLSASYDKKLGICLVAGNDGSTTTMLLWGKVRSLNDDYPTLTVGSPVYMSETAGAITQTAPTTTDSATRVIGFSNTADELFFCPDSSYYTHT